MQRPFVLIIYGPTAVGKTDCALGIANHIPAEIINMDVGQFYTPLSIGTAKPDWQQSPIPHHLFDILDTPSNFTISDYRDRVYKLIGDIIARKKVPILVGGSGFYLYSLLFCAAHSDNSEGSHYDAPPAEKKEPSAPSVELWQELHLIDPVRADSIDPSDRYRIERALDIWHRTKKLPSSFIPIYNPQADYSIIFMGRDRQDLVERIAQRVDQMLETGWIEEAQKLCNTDWQQFLCKKNLIGYPEIFQYLSNSRQSSLSHVSNAISIRTRQYAKRQFTFWRKLEREIKKEKLYTGPYVGCLESINVTHVGIDTLINQVIPLLHPLLNGLKDQE
jgi:tRNA dimethylallyltransferase